MQKRQRSYIPPDKSRRFTEEELLNRETSRDYIYKLRSDPKSVYHHSGRGSNFVVVDKRSPLHCQKGSPTIGFDNILRGREEELKEYFDKTNSKKLREDLNLAEQKTKGWNGNSHQDHSLDMHRLSKTMKHAIRQNPFNEGYQHVFPEHGATLIPFIRQSMDASSSSHVQDQTNYYNPRDYIHSARAPDIRKLNGG